MLANTSHLDNKPTEHYAVKARADQSPQNTADTTDTWQGHNRLSVRSAVTAYVDKSTEDNAANAEQSEMIQFTEHGEDETYQSAEHSAKDDEPVATTFQGPYVMTSTSTELQVHSLPDTEDTWPSNSLAAAHQIPMGLSPEPGRHRMVVSAAPINLQVSNVGHVQSDASKYSPTDMSGLASAPSNKLTGHSVAEDNAVVAPLQPELTP
jgi:hypothetical protein